MTALPVYCCLVFIVSLSLRSNACWIPFSTTKLFGMLDEAESSIQFHWSVLQKDAIYPIIRIENDFEHHIKFFLDTGGVVQLNVGDANYLNSPRWFTLVTSRSQYYMFCVALFISMNWEICRKTVSNASIEQNLLG